MIEFILNQKKVSTNINSGENLLQFIRENELLKGTKVGCREGDCGACTVLVGTLQENDLVAYISVTSCLASLASVAGKHVVTIEGLNLENKLNKAQQAMHENFATQCGFCSPGIVVSMTGAALETKHQTHVKDAVSGNICRCTGYKSIEKAVTHFENEGGNTSQTLEWYIENHFVPSYFSEIPSQLKLLHSYKTNPIQQIIGGGTDLYVREADALAEIKINYFEGNKTIDIQKDKIILGGNVTVSQLWNSQELIQIFPKLQSHLKLVSSQQIRNMATLAGNFVNASPIGDLTVFFLALNASLTLKNNQNGVRNILLKDFFKDYKKVDLLKNEWIETIECSIPKNNFKFNFEKVSKRTHLDIAGVNSAFLIEVKDAKIESVHISMGGVAAIPKYLENTSRFLFGKSLDKLLIIEASAIMQTEISPIDDLRGTAAYKRLLAKQLFFAHFIELFPEHFSLSNLLD